jgi:hypothetical protein
MTILIFISSTALLLSTTLGSVAYAHPNTLMLNVKGSIAKTSDNVDDRSLSLRHRDADGQDGSSTFKAVEKDLDPHATAVAPEYQEMLIPFTDSRGALQAKFWTSQFNLPVLGKEIEDPWGTVAAALTAEKSAGRIVLEEPGMILVREDFACAESPTSPTSLNGDMVIEGRMRLPAYATQATVFLNGWRLLFIDESEACTTSDADTPCFAWQQSPPAIDHHLQSMRVWMFARQNGDTLTWEVHGHLQDKSADDPFALCYAYMTIAWNDTLMDAHADNDGDQNWRINPPGATVRMSSSMPNPAPASAASAAVLPRGAWITWAEDTDHHLLQIAYKYTQGRGPTGTVTWDSEAIFKDNAQWRSYSLNEWAAALAGRHVDVLQPAFAIAPRQAPGGDACIALNYPTYRTTEYEVHDLPFAYAVPMLTGWDLWYPCGDEHVGELGVWVHDVEYDQYPDGSGGTLRYKVTSVLRDQDSRPGHGSRPMVSILGLHDPRPTTQDVHFDNAIVGFVSLAPDSEGLIRNGDDVPLLITDAVQGGAQQREFMIELAYRGDVFLLYDLPQYAPLVLLPGEELRISGRFAPSVEAPVGTPPRFAWIDFQTPDPRWPSIRLQAIGHTIPAQPAGYVLPATIDFGFVDIHTSNHPLGFPKRNALIVSTGSTPLLIQSLALVDDTLGFISHVTDVPPQDANLVGGSQIYQLNPGEALTIQITFYPTTVGSVQTMLIAETNAGPIALSLWGEGVD